MGAGDLRCIRREAAVMHECENTLWLCMYAASVGTCVWMLWVYLGCPTSVCLPYGNLNHIIFTLVVRLRLYKPCCLRVQCTHNRSHEIIMLLHSHTPLCVSGLYPKALSYAFLTGSCRQWQVTWSECVTGRLLAQPLIHFHEHLPINTRTYSHVWLGVVGAVCSVNIMSSSSVSPFHLKPLKLWSYIFLGNCIFFFFWKFITNIKIYFSAVFFAIFPVTASSCNYILKWVTIKKINEK